MKTSSEFFDIMILLVFALGAGLLITGILLVVNWVIQQPATPESDLALPQLVNIVDSYD